MAIYMRPDNIAGSVTTEGYSDWIDCIDLSFAGISSHIQQHIGSDMDRVVNHPVFGDISIVKFIDRSSIALFEHAHSRKPFKELAIHSVNTSDPIFTFAKLSLKDAIIRHYSELSSNHMNTKPREHIVFTYTAIEKTFIPKNPDNTPGSPIISGYDLSQGEAM